MTRKIKTEEVLAAYNVLGSAKYTKLEDAEKIAVWKIARALKPVAVEYKETKEDAETKLKPTKESTGYDYDEQMQKAVVFENLRRMPDADMTKAEMGPAEYGEFLKESTSYTKRVNDALREYAHKDVYAIT